jgi:hypothetical protein
MCERIRVAGEYLAPVMASPRGHEPACGICSRGRIRAWLDLRGKEMPTPDSIVSGLTAIANEWRTLAIGWHLVFGALLLAVGAGWRPSHRHAGYLLAAPLLSVAGLAWMSANPFNGTIFSALAVLLLPAARRFVNQPVHLSSLPFLLPGALLLAFGWSYPHFVKVDHWTEYAYAAPLGIVPCPTLSILIGFTLVFGLFRSQVWATALAAAGLLYGVIGIFRLGVPLDYGLLAGAAALAVAGWLPSTISLRREEAA